MMPHDHSRLGDLLGYHFKDPALLAKALTHRSASAANNERLEYLGDAILDLVIADELFHRFPDASEGELTRMRSALVKGKTLSKIAHELSLGDFLALGSGEIKSGGQHRESILADAVEALLGAIYLESGLEAARSRIGRWFGGRLEAMNLDFDEKDAKTSLQEWLQARGRSLPIYEVISTDGEAHDQVMTVSCSVEGLDVAVTATGGSRKRAEKKAAQLALAKLQQDRHDTTVGHD
jgi:ribonuclease III